MRFFLIHEISASSHIVKSQNVHSLKIFVTRVSLLDSQEYPASEQPSSVNFKSFPALNQSQKFPPFLSAISTVQDVFSTRVEHLLFSKNTNRSPLCLDSEWRRESGDGEEQKGEEQKAEERA